MRIASGTSRAADKDPPMVIDFAKVEELPPNRRRRVHILLQLAQSPNCSAEERHAIFATIREVMDLRTPGKLIDPEDVVDPAAHAAVADFYGNVGRAIKVARTVRNLTQEVVAKRAGIPQPHLSRIETGEHIPTRTTLVRIAKALGTTIDHLASAGEETARPASRKAKTGEAFEPTQRERDRQHVPHYALQDLG